MMDSQRTPAAPDATAPPGLAFPSKLSQPAQRALAAAGYSRLEQLTAVSESALMQLHGIGPQALRQLRQALADRGLAFAESPLKDVGARAQ